MYQIEVKRHLIQRKFSPSDGWKVTVDLDAMELGKGIQNSEDKRKLAQEHLRWFEEHGVKIGAHSEFGRTDIVAEHEKMGCHIIEAEGDARKQREQAMYSALGQTILQMKESDCKIVYGLAVPDSAEWERQLKKIPKHVCKALVLKLYLVSKDAIREM